MQKIVQILTLPGLLVVHLNNQRMPPESLFKSFTSKLGKNCAHYIHDKNNQITSVRGQNIRPNSNCDWCK